MNELTTFTNNIAKINRSELAKEILRICFAITPQFYKNKSSEELQAEKYSIELLTAGIEQDVLAVMCKIAVNQYPLERSRDKRAYFDINYILTFYEKAFNWFWCDRIEVDYKCFRVRSEFDPLTNILTEFWEREGKEFIIKFLVPAEENNLYRCGKIDWLFSPKVNENLKDQINDPDYRV